MKLRQMCEAVELERQIGNDCTLMVNMSAKAPPERSHSTAERYRTFLLSRRLIFRDDERALKLSAYFGRILPRQGPLMAMPPSDDHRMTPPHA